MAWWEHDVPWENRLPEDYHVRKQRLLQDGILVHLQAYEDDGFLALSVKPLEEPLMLEPPNKQTPWHVTIGRCPPAQAKLVRKAFAKPQLRRLQFEWISWGVVGYIAELDDVIRIAHSSSDYKDRPLHISW